MPKEQKPRPNKLVIGDPLDPNYWEGTIQPYLTVAGITGIVIASIIVIAWEIEEWLFM